MDETRLGRVTMIFTDIEGSTRLAGDLGSLWPSVLEDHHRLLREAIEAQQGVIEVREGDAVFALFEHPRCAVAAALAGQAALRGHAWPAQRRVRVRMGIHCGEISRLPSGVCVGLDIHLAARIASASNGDQILLSQATAASVPDVLVEDLGFHRLKDFPASQRLFHVVDGEGSAPTPRTLSARPTNLPTRYVQLVGRDRELGEIRERVLDRGERLLTLTGPGGSGKTSLAIEAAAGLLDEHPGGVFLVRLAALREVASITPAIAEAAGIAQAAGGDLLDAACERFGSLPTLLVLDNAEHLVDGLVPLLDQLVSHAPTLRVLVTSQVPMRVLSESLLAVPALEPEPAVELFEQRLAAAGVPVGDEMRPVAERICRRVSGLPLAVELAAARVPALGLDGVEQRLDDSLSVLSRGPRDLPERQRSLRQTLEWTCDLLEPDGRTLLTRMSVFAGPVPLDALEAVCGAGIATLDALAALVELSLVQRRDDLLFGVRYTLPEAVRAFASERLIHERDSQEHHARHIADVGWAARLWVFGPTDLQRRNVLALAAEERPALTWAREAHPELHLRLAGALGTSWLFRGQPLEAIDHLAHAISTATTTTTDELLWARGVLAHLLAAVGRAKEACEHADAVASAWQDRGDTIGLSLALNVRSYARLAVGDLDGSMADAEAANEGLDTSGDVRLRARGLILLATKRVAFGDPTTVEPLIDAADELVNDADVAIYVRDIRADCSLMRRDFETARARFLDVARHAPEAPEMGLYATYALEGLAMALAGLGYADAALALFGAYAAGAAEIGIDSPEHPWRKTLRDELRSSAHRAAAGDAERRLAEGRAMPAGRRLGWAIQQAEQALDLP